MNQQNQHMGFIMIISGATLWGLSGPMIQWLFQHSSISSIDFLVFRLILAGIFLLLYLSFSKKQIFEIWKHAGDRIQIILFAAIGMLGAQYFLIEIINVNNTILAMMFPLFAT